MTKKAKVEAAIEEAKKELMELFEKHGYVVYTKLDHVSKSGMLRRISCYIETKDGFTKNITDLVGLVAGYTVDGRTGVGLRVSGCGMDMGFSVVYNLSSTMFRSKDGSYSHDGAYKIKQRWL